MDYTKIKKPSIILDEDKCRNNIRNMVSRAEHSSVTLRPHFKTHQSLTVGEWFRDEGVKQITVSSVTMAKHFGMNGWDDITLAFPLNPREADDLGPLSDKCSLNIISPGPEHLDIILPVINFEAGCFVKLNTGLNRSGIEWDDHNSILRMAEIIDNSETLRFTGFITHSGHTYKAGSRDEIVYIYRDTLIKATSTRKLLPDRSFCLSTGDTPSCSIADDFTGFDEIRPGNFVFYDLTQEMLGSCTQDQIAIAVACPVVEKNYRRNEIIIYGGGVHLSKESLCLPDGRIVFGEVVLFNDTEWVFPEEKSYLTNISQEHGIIAASGDLFKLIKPGDLLGIIPVHSCMTADLLREYHTFGDEIIKDLSQK